MAAMQLGEAAPGQQPAAAAVAGGVSQQAEDGDDGEGDPGQQGQGAGALGSRSAIFVYTAPGLR